MERGTVMTGTDITSAAIMVVPANVVVLVGDKVARTYPAGEHVADHLGQGAGADHDAHPR